MKMNSLIIIIFLLFFSCEREPIIPPETPIVPKIIQWKYDVDLSMYNNEVQIDPILYDSLFIIGFASDLQDRNVPLLMAYNKVNGKKMWEYRHPQYSVDLIRNIKAKDNYALLKFRDGIVCLDLRDLTVVWQSMITEEIAFEYAMEIYNDGLYLSEYYYENPNTYPFNDSASLVKYNIYTGYKEKLFGERIKNNDCPLLHPPVITMVDNKEIAVFTKAYLSSGPSKPVDMIAINTSTKERIWVDSAYSHLQSAWNTPPFVFENNVICSSDYSLYSWDLQSGTLNWNIELYGLNKLGGFSSSGPFLNGDKIYAISNDGKLFCVNAHNGSLIWENTMDNGKEGGPAKGPCINPLIFQDYLFVNAGRSQSLMIFDINTGKILEKWSAAKYNGSNVLYDEETETFYVTTDDKWRAFTIKK